MAIRSKRGFYRSKGRVVLLIDRHEAGTLFRLVVELLARVQPARSASTDPLAAMVGIDEEAVRPSDPALLRLFPDGYRDDPGANAEFRRFTERGMREAKVERMRSVVAVIRRLTQDPVPHPTVIDSDEQQALLLTLNDLRLFLGARLEIVEDDQDVGSNWDDDDPRWPMLAEYQWLTWLQATELDSLR